MDGEREGGREGGREGELMGCVMVDQEQGYYCQSMEEGGVPLWEISKNVKWFILSQIPCTINYAI